MKPIVTKEELKELKKIKGEVRGIVIETYGKFILKEEGEKGLRKLEEEMNKIGYPIKYREVRVTQFYPLILEAVTLTVIKKLFKYDDKKFQEMGRFEAKADNIILRFFFRYLVSLETVTKAVSKMWRTYFTVGDIKTVDFDEEKRYVILRLENFRFIPILCQNLKGYFEGMTEIILKKKTTCKETKCIYRGDDYHEFVIKW